MKNWFKTLWLKFHFKTYAILLILLEDKWHVQCYDKERKTSRCKYCRKEIESVYK
jgi:hypothetical protein